jgi:hypothetical protein
MPRRVHPPAPGAGAGGLIVIPRPFEGHRIGSCRNTHDGSLQNMIRLEINAAINGVLIRP